MTDTVERAIRLEGAYNVRDLGGLRTANGNMVRTGRLYRADSLSALTDSDLEILAGKRLATVIDLRTTHEIETQGLARLVDSGARHLHLSILEGNFAADGLRDVPESLGELYVGMVERASDRFVRLFETIATPGSLPAVFHCSAGKDRTGVTASLILGMLDVPKETIVADYAVTDANMRAHLAKERMNTTRATGRFPESYTRALPETMAQFLTVLEERWGSVKGYLDHIGVERATRDAIASELLV
jgi:protein-tyrosine phosphatase